MCVREPDGSLVVPASSTRRREPTGSVPRPSGSGQDEVSHHSIAVDDGLCRAHGDARGSHHRLHRTYGMPPLPERPRLEAMERLQAGVPAQFLDARSRAIVERVASDVCEHRGWDLLAANARTNHVHLVVAAGCAPEDLALSLKSWMTRRLVEAGALPPHTRLWSRHASTGRVWPAQGPSHTW